MRRQISAICLTLLLLLVVQPALAASDTRMQVLITPDEAHGITLASLRANIAQAADMALPRLWSRIVPQQARKNIPGNVQAMRFLQRATPGDAGVMVAFQPRRVFAWLKANNIPYIAEMPVWNVTVSLQDAGGRNMAESAARLRDYAEGMASTLGYAADISAPALVLEWRWLDSRQVSLSVRGNSRLGEYAETRSIGSGDPVQQLQPWLEAVMVRARDAYVESAVEAVPVAAAELQPEQTLRANEITGVADAAGPAAEGYLILKVQRHAPLPEQILFEQDLRQDPRILDLSLRQVNRDEQQYRLHLKGADDVWLRDWFARRGLMLKPTIEGWVASQEMPAR